jgi:hypothetical protein
MDLNNEDSSTSVLMSLLLDEYPETELNFWVRVWVLRYDRRAAGQSVLE